MRKRTRWLNLLLRRSALLIGKSHLPTYMNPVGKSAIHRLDFILKLGLNKRKNYFQRYYTDTRKTWFYCRSLTRKYIVTVNRCRADHYNLVASLAGIGIVNSPSCKCGSVSKDLNHVLWQCPLYVPQRSKLLKILSKIKMYIPLCVEMFLAKPNIVACCYIVQFLKECNLSI